MAFEYLYDRYSGALFNLILGIVQNDRAQGEDILQETFAKIWRGIQKYDESKGRLFTWMHRIARNTAIDAIRSNMYRQVHETAAAEISHRLPAQQPLSSIWNDVALLEEKHSILLKMAYFQGYTQEEISLMLDIPLHTVKYRLKVALKELGKLILTIFLIFMF